MPLNVPIARPEGDFTKTFSDDITPGVYDAKLISVDECVIPPFQGKGEPSPGVRFNYEIDFGDGEQPVAVVREVRATISTTGNTSLLYRDLMGLAQDKLTDDILHDDQKLNQFIESLVGSQCKITVASKISTKGKAYPHFSSVAPATAGGRRKKAEPKAEKKEEPTSFDDDDIKW